MSDSFLATFQYVKGGGTIIPFTGRQDASASSPSIIQIGKYSNNNATAKLPTGNTGTIVARVTDPAFITPPSLGLLVLQTIGATMDLSYTTFSTTLVIPLPADVLTFYRSVSLIPTGTALDIVIPRFISASFLGGEG